MDKSLGFNEEKLPLATSEESNEEPPKDEDVWEAPSGYLRCARHQVFAVELIKKDGELLVIPYSAVEIGSGKFNGDRFAFRFVNGDVLYEAVIEGTITHTQRVVDKIAGGKAEMIRANGDEIRSVTWAPVKEEESDDRD
jgi:hypothetical protein